MAGSKDVIVCAISGSHVYRGDKDEKVAIWTRGDFLSGIRAGGFCFVISSQDQSPVHLRFSVSPF